MSLRLSNIIAALTFVIITIASTHSAHANPFAEVPKVMDIQISPDGKQIAFIEVIKDYNVLTVASTVTPETRENILVLDVGGEPEWFKWANNNRVLIKTGSVIIYNNGPPSYTGKLFSVDVETGKTIKLISSSVVDFLESDPNHILMSATNRKMARQKRSKVFSEVRKVNVETNKYEIIQTYKKDVQSWMTDLQERVRIGSGIPWGKRNSKHDSRKLQIFDLESKTWNPSSRYPGLSASTKIFGFTEDPSEIVIGDYAGQNTVGLYVYSLVEKKTVRKLYHNPTYDTTSVLYSADGKSVLGASYIADQKVTVRFTDTAPIERTEMVSFMGQSVDQAYSIYYMSGPQNPGKYYLRDEKNGQQTLLAERYPDIKSNQLGKIISTSYQARDGYTVPAFITLPPNTHSLEELKNSSVIVLPHGGPNARDFADFDYLAQSFASKGHAVLQMNFRGSEGYGRFHEEQGLSKWKTMEQDVSDGSKWLIDMGYADSEKICIGGWSFGGYAALMSTANNPSLYTCTFSIAGVTDIEGLAEDLKDYMYGTYAAQQTVYKGFDSKQERLENSPVYRVEDISNPVFLTHAQFDVNVRFSQFTKLVTAMEKNSTANLTAKEFRSDTHYFKHPKNRREMMLALHKFLDENLEALE